MDYYELFDKFNTTTTGANPQDFIINVLIIIVLSFVLEWTYNKCARSLSNRKMFSANFLLIAFTTMLIITVVKSSIALSLGLVGALSIVRFRSAIKEPEELAYIFLTISLGLGLGADQRIITLIAFIAIMAIIWLRFVLSKKANHQNLYLNVSLSGKEFNLQDVLEILKKIFGSAKVNRYDKKGDDVEATFIIDSRKTDLLQQSTALLEEKYPDISISYVDYQ